MSEDTGALYRKYRPKTFDDMLGNQALISSLKAVFKKKTKPHAFLFTGPSGCGKTTLARIIANQLGCSERDFYEYDAANLRGIGTIREIISACKYAPLNGPAKVYLLDECHQLTGDAAEALLKLLEDTPDHVYLVLGTTEPEALMQTIMTRVSAYEVQPLGTATIFKLLKQVSSEEGVEMETDVLKAIATRCDGSPRKALVFLQQVMGIEDSEEAVSIIKNAVANEVSAKNICKIIMKPGDARYKWQELAPMLRTIKTEPESLRYAILGYLGAVMLSKPNDRLAEMILTVFSESWMYSKKAGMIASIYIACKT